MSAPTTVHNDRIREHAERLAGSPVTRGALSTAFEETHASSVEVLVEGKAFYPPMLEDISSATSSIHINQFGFRPFRFCHPASPIFSKSCGVCAGFDGNQSWAYRSISRHSMRGG